MVISDNIFRLIKSLTKQEKIYFKRYGGVQVKGDNNMYIKLFDEIAGMKEYDEEILKRKFKGEKFINQISVAKNYLYHAILKTLKTMRKVESKKEEINSLFEDVGILFAKRLYSQCRKILRKCRSIAMEYEKYPELIEILVWESKLNYADNSIKKKQTEVLNQNYEERKKYLKILENMYEYDRLEYNFTAFTREVKIKDARYRKSLDEFIKNPMMKSEELALSTVAKLKYNAVKSSYYYVTEDYAKSLKYETKQVEILDKNSGIKSERFTDYLVLLSNILLLCVVLEDEDEFKKYLLKFRMQMEDKTVLKSNFYQAYIIERSYLMEMYYYNKKGEFKEAVKMYEKLHKEVDELGIKIRDSEVVNLKYLLVAAYFGMKEYRKSLEILNEVLGDKEAEARITEYLTARLFNLILHYEMGNMDLLEYGIDSTQKFIKERRRLSSFEKLFIKLMNRLVKCKPGEMKSEIFGEFMFELNKIEESEYKTGLFDRVDLIEWVENKVTVKN